jgi:hypothetical protein
MKDIKSKWKDNTKFAKWLVKETKPRTIVDIGTYEGYSAKAFSNQMDSGLVEVFTIDPEDHKKDLPKNVHFINKTSKEAYIEWNTAIEIDILHIDGNHTYEIVKEDLMNWASLLNPKGVILMHDIINMGIAGFGPIKVFLGNTIPYKACYFVGFGLGILTWNADLMAKILDEYREDILTAPQTSQYWVEQLIKAFEDGMAMGEIETVETEKGVEYYDK